MLKKQNSYKEGREDFTSFSIISLIKQKQYPLFLFYWYIIYFQ